MTKIKKDNEGETRYNNDNTQYNLREDMTTEEEKKIELEDFIAQQEYDEGEEAADATNEDHIYDLNYYGMDLDIAGMVKRVQEEKIVIPEFQRKFVWNKPRASKFIESLLLGLPSPEFFFYKEKDKTMLVIDGFQRLSSLKAFYENNFNGKPFKLNYPKISNDLKHLSYEDLEPSRKTGLDYSVIHVTVISAENPIEKNYKSIYHVFERLNSGGMNLTPQEIRNCIYLNKKALKFIKKTEISSFFTKDMKINALRGKHEEMALRVLALSTDLGNYNGNMNRFINDFLTKDEISSKDQEKYLETIEYIKTNINHEEHFKQEKSKTNLAILDTVFVGIFRHIDNIRDDDKEKINEIIKNMLAEEDFKKFILYGRTHNTRSMKDRIDFFLNKLKNLNERK